MSDAVVFIVVFVGLFAVRILAATVLFFWILPGGDRCPCCDAVTLRVPSVGWNALMPWFRTSWCIECGWEGMLRGQVTPPPISGELAARHCTRPTQVTGTAEFHRLIAA